MEIGRAGYGKRLIHEKGDSMGDIKSHVLADMPYRSYFLLGLNMVQ